MKAIYDPETDTLTFILRKGSVKESDELKEKEGGVILIEVLDASLYTGSPWRIYESQKAATKR
jgi:uncharacterized protein YuzE